MWGRKRLRRETVNQRWRFYVWAGGWTAVAKADEDTAQDGSGLCSYMLGFVCGMSCVRTEWK